MAGVAVEGWSLWRFLNVVEVLAVRRYGAEAVAEWLVLAPRATVAAVTGEARPVAGVGPTLPPIDRDTWGTSPQAVEGHRAMMNPAPRTT